jgi:hypothetical protein
MRLFEISGDNEEYVYNKLRTIYLIIQTYSSTQTISPEFEKLFNDNISLLQEDIINLNYWVLTSERISKLYSEIKRIT